MQAVHSGFTSQRQALQNADGLRRTMMFSLGIHLTVVAMLFVIPRSWFVKEQPHTIPVTLQMGSPGERTGGMNPAGAQPIQEVAPPPPRPTPLPVVTPPKASAAIVAAKTPAKTPADTPPAPASVPKPPVTGAKITPGTAAAATGSVGQNSGLSVGGGAGGTTAQLDASFCCPAYITEMQRRIEERWDKNQQEIGETIIVFEIRRDGSISKPEVEKTSGFVMLDLAAKSVFTGLVLRPLPDQFPGSTLKIHMIFPYKR
jgi:protein TonB